MAIYETTGLSSYPSVLDEFDCLLGTFLSAQPDLCLFSFSSIQSGCYFPGCALSSVLFLALSSVLLLAEHRLTTHFPKSLQEVAGGFSVTVCILHRLDTHWTLFTLSLILTRA
jgi:hypothetical protein